MSSANTQFEISGFVYQKILWLIHFQIFGGYCVKRWAVVMIERNDADSIGISNSCESDPKWYSGVTQIAGAS